MKIKKDRSRVLVKTETFWADAALVERLLTIPSREKSFIIRMALRDWFGMTDSRRGIVGYQETIDDIETAIERRCEND